MVNIRAFSWEGGDGKEELVKKRQTGCEKWEGGRAVNPHTTTPNGNKWGRGSAGRGGVPSKKEKKKTSSNKKEHKDVHIPRRKEGRTHRVWASRRTETRRRREKNQG